MTKNYYSVTLKCGHVGRNRYLVREVPVHAEDGRTAASIARWMGRVKHHDKHAILSVNKIEKEEYLELYEKKNSDPFFNVHNIQDQRIIAPSIEEEAIYIDDEIDYEARKEQRKNRVEYKQRKNRLFRSESSKMIREYQYSC